ncbi:sperm microtubule associated protein 1-like [Rhinoraja longicauda]
MDNSPCPPGVCFLDYEYFKREKGFVLDCVAVSNNSLAYERAHPKLCDVIPPYNAQSDPYSKHAFGSKSMRKLLRRTNQDHGGTSNSGWIVDYFYKNGPAQRYLSKRNIYGAGHSLDQVIGHRGYLMDIKPISGYNGQFGYRRTTPSLRLKPTIFGDIFNLPLH